MNKKTLANIATVLVERTVMFSKRVAGIFSGVLLPKMLCFFSADSRKRLAVWMSRKSWIPAHNELTIAIIRDWAENDPEAFHRFLWTNHIGYAKIYERVHKFGSENLLLARKMFLEDLKKNLLQMNIDPAQDVKSVFDVGCSAGYLLHVLENDYFPSATVLRGIDIDKYAIKMGRHVLYPSGSKIELIEADMENLDRVMGEQKYDVILCTGVLLYVVQRSAAKVVASMLKHSKGLVAISGLAHPVINNAELGYSVPRIKDGTFIHNIDAMVKNAGGTVIHQRWEGPKMFDGQTVYFVYAQPRAGFEKRGHLSFLKNYFLESSSARLLP